MAACCMGPAGCVVCMHVRIRQSGAYARAGHRMRRVGSIWYLCKPYAVAWKVLLYRSRPQRMCACVCVYGCVAGACTPLEHTSPVYLRCAELEASLDRADAAAQAQAALQAALQDAGTRVAHLEQELTEQQEQARAEASRATQALQALQALGEEQAQGTAAAQQALVAQAQCAVEEGAAQLAAAHRQCAALRRQVVLERCRWVWM